MAWAIFVKNNNSIITLNLLTTAMADQSFMRKKHIICIVSDVGNHVRYKMYNQ